MGNSGLGHSLTIEDKTFVPDAATMAQVDPTWDYAKWGGEGNLWVPHVYMPAQNPGSAHRLQPVRPVDVRPVVLAAVDGPEVPADRQPVLRPELRPGRAAVL